MANPFLNKTDLMDRDLDTAILLDKAIIHDIGDAVAYTDGVCVFLNTDDNLFRILPAYDQRMLKWLLWHERMHLELRHHNRFFRYVSELTDAKTIDEFHITKDEVNIIMDILVHDWMAKKFPELVETAANNLAQFRDRNSLGYTFTTYTLEEMLDEYAKYKHGEDDPSKSKGGTPTDEPTEGKGIPVDDPPKGGKGTPTEDPPKDDKDSKPADEPTEDAPSEGTGGTPKETDTPTKEKKDDEPTTPGHHDKTDWSKLDKIDSKEFITKEEGRYIQKAVEKLKRKKIRLGQLTQTLNGLVTTTRHRTYSMPSLIHTGGGMMLKGSTPGRTKLYLVFDASGSMSGEIDMFKDIIGKSIPQAMDTPCEWFAGYGADIDPYKSKYYKGTFKDFEPVLASGGYSDDGDRTIELCWEAEQKGYSPIGVTDGGGQLEWSKDKLKQLKRTVLVGHSTWWFAQVKKVNPTLQVIDVSDITD